MSIRGDFHRRRLAALAVLLAMCGTTSPASADSSPSGDEIGRAGDVRVLGRTIAEWEDWFKSLELTSPATRAAEFELSQLARDRQAPGGLRRQATLTLGRIRPAVESAVATFGALLEETEPCETGDVPRSWALKGIGLLGAPAAELTPRVVAIVQAPETTVLDRLLSLEALARIGPAHPRTLGAVVRVLEMGPPAAARLPSDVDRAATHMQFRRVAADVLSLFGPSAATAVPALLAAAREADEPLRRAAVATLGTTRQATTLEPLTDILLFDESPAVQDAAAVALSQLGAPAVERLIDLLDNPDAEIQQRATDALGRMESTAVGAVPRLKVAVESPESGVRLAAAEALWRIDKRIDPSLAAAIAGLSGAERQDRMRAHRLIMQIGRESRDPEVLTRLHSLLDSADPRVRQAAYLAIREIGE